MTRSQFDKLLTIVQTAIALDPSKCRYGSGPVTPRMQLTIDLKHLALAGLTGLPLHLGASGTTKNASRRDTGSDGGEIVDGFTGAGAGLDGGEIVDGFTGAVLMRSFFSFFLFALCSFCSGTKSESSLLSSVTMTCNVLIMWTYRPFERGYADPFVTVGTLTLNPNPNPSMEETYIIKLCILG